MRQINLQAFRSIVALSICALPLGLTGCGTTSGNGHGSSPQIIFFRASPSSIRSSETAILKWRTRNADLVEISGLGTVSARGTERVSPPRDTAYTLVARNSNGQTVTQDLMVRLLPGRSRLKSPPDASSDETQETPIVQSFVATASQIRAGDTTTLRWRTCNATHVEISGIGNVATSGIRQVSPTRDTTYTLTTRNGGRETRRSVTIRIRRDKAHRKSAPSSSSGGSAPIPLVQTFRATPSSITVGETATLTWIARNADQVHISGIGNVAAQGTHRVAPSRDTTYTIVVRVGKRTVRQSITVRVVSSTKRSRKN